MSYGFPVILTFNCGAAIELVEDGVNGYLVNVEDDYQLAEKINFLLFENEIISSMSSNNIKKISNYSLESMTEIIFKILNSYYNLDRINNEKI